MRKATYNDKQLVSDILVSAFKPHQGKSAINLVVKQDEKRTERMHILMRYLFDKAYYAGEIYISDNDNACVLLLHSYKEKTTLKSIVSNIELAIKCIGISRVYKVLKRQKLMQSYYPKEHHIRPLITGVKSECDGQGAAARLMLEIMKKYKHNELPVIIDAASVKNAKLYQKIGFKLFKEEKGLGFPVYLLRLN